MSEAARAAGQTTTETAAALLSVNNIEVIYDHVILVLKGVSLEVPDGGIAALLGANGAGKTTTLKAVSNLLGAERGEVTKGSILFQGEPVQSLTPNALVRRGSAFLPACLINQRSSIRSGSCSIAAKTYSICSSVPAVIPITA